MTPSLQGHARHGTLVLLYMVQWSAPLIYWTAIELFFDVTNHTVDENSEL